MKLNPVYYRWCYSPSTGDVSLSHNHEGHPADIDFHADMADRRVENDIEVGYAYKLDNGWKVTDADHKAVDDPHVRLTVEKAIADYESHPKEIRTSAKGEWYDDNREGQLRYGAVFTRDGSRKAYSSKRYRP